MDNIILYTLNCPRCIVLERKLDDKGINVVKISDEEEMKKLGILSVPMLKVEDKLLNFNEAIKWINS